MLLSLFLLEFAELQINNDVFEYLGNYIPVSYKKSAIKSVNSDWFFIRFNDFASNCKDKLQIDQNISISSDSQLTSNTCLAFLNSTQVLYLKKFYSEQSESIIINKLDSKSKLHHQEYSKDFFNGKTLAFIARFHPSFVKPQNLIGNLTKLSEEIYSYQIKNPFTKKNADLSSFLTEVLSIPELRSISPHNPSKLLNRWNRGFLQKNQWPGGIDISENNIVYSKLISSGQLTTTQYFNEKGLNGTGQIITIVDSGLDVNSPYFIDSTKSSFSYDRVDHTNRKVVYYQTYGNNQDSLDMHGTYLAGIVSGYVDNNKDYDADKFNLYQGVAPGSKLAIVDIVEHSDDSSQILSYSSILLGDAMGRVDSKIALSGWGTSKNVEMSYYYDSLAETNPERLLIFPVGNGGGPSMKITTPGDGKNVLTVGALDSLWTSKYETNRVYQLFTKSNQVFKLKRLIYGVDLFYLIKQNYIIENAQTTTNFDSASGKVLLTTQKDFCGSIPKDSSIKAVVFVGDEFDSNQCGPTDNFPFPVFQTSETVPLSEETVTIKIVISDNETEINLRAAEYSSRGPSYCGVQKPDVIAPGTSIFSSDSEFVSESGGTSNAAAYVTGIAALLYEYFERGFYPTGQETPANSFTPTSDLIRAMIINSADPIPFDKSYTNGKRQRSLTRTPDSEAGHGLVNLGNIIDFQPHMKVFTNIKIESEQHFYTKFKVDLSDTVDLDLRIAFACHDTASTNEIVALSSDVDIYLKLPNNTIIYGNHHPEDFEDRLSTVERILIYNEELRELNMKYGNTYELHFMTNTQISTLNHNGILSVAISGPFINPDLNSNDATTLQTARDFPELSNPDQFENFNFYKGSAIEKCNESYYGNHCQHPYIEMLPNGTTNFTLYRNTAVLAKVKLPSDYSALVLRLARFPETAGRISFQICIENNNQYGLNYPWIVSLTNHNSAVSLTRRVFGYKDYLGIRITNMGGMDYDLQANIAIKHDETPKQTPTASPDMTIPPEVVINLAVSYGLFGVVLIPTIIVFLLLVRFNKKVKQYRATRSNTQNLSERLQSESNGLQNGLLNDGSVEP